MGMLAKALGLGFEVQHEGKRYKFASAASVEVRGRFEILLEDRAIQKATAHARGRKPGEATALLQAVTRDVAAGAYSFGTEAYRAAACGPWGLRELLRVMLEVGGGEDFSPELVDELVEHHGEEISVKLAVDLGVPPEDEGGQGDAGTGG